LLTISRVLSQVALCQKFIVAVKLFIMENEQQPESKKVPFYRMIMDDFMLLLFLGVTIYAVFYLLWGVMELSNLPSIPEEIKNNLIK
jgi:hypothetical protein